MHETATERVPDNVLETMGGMNDLSERNGRRAVAILGVPFADLTFEEACTQIMTLVHAQRSAHVVLANAHTLNLAYEHPAYREALTSADLVLRDGIGVELAARIAGSTLQYNFCGTDFVPALLSALGSVMRPTVFLYGARPGVASRAATRLSSLASGIEVVGALDGYGGERDAVEAVARTAPDILLVALGNPRQELWIGAHRDRLNVGVAIGVGALFDFLAGEVPRAPHWLRAMRAEWLFRLAVEPRRLANRYIVGNPKFLWRVIRNRHATTAAR